MPQMGPQLLNELKNDLTRLKRAHTWHRIGLVLFNRDGSYAHKILHGVFLPSKKALDFYLAWRALNKGRREEASPELCKAVWEYLPEGREHPRTSLDMAEYFLIDRRKIRKACGDLVIHGWKITDSEGNVVEEMSPRAVGSCQAGYYRIVKPSEKAEAERKLLSHERGIRNKRLSLRRIRLIDQDTKGVMIKDDLVQLQLVEDGTKQSGK